MKKIQVIIMHRLSRHLIVTVVFILQALFSVKGGDFNVDNSFATPIEGRWDLTINVEGKEFHPG